MTRSRAAVLFSAAFLALFFFSGVNASMTVEGSTASVSIGMGAVVFSLSSINVLILPLVIAFMLIAIINLLNNKNSVGMLFTALSTIGLAAFLVLYSRERLNNSLYASLSGALGEMGVKFKKRDVTGIDVSYPITAYLTVLVGIIAAFLAAPPLKTKHDRHLMRRAILPYAYIGPHLFFFIIFFVTPAIYGVYAAFTKWDLFSDPAWVGLANFRTILFDSGNTYYKQLRNGLWNTFKFVLFSVPFCIIVPLTLSMALSTRGPGNKFFQTIYYLPSLMSISTVVIAWRYMFFKSYGAMNHFLMTKPDWLTPPYSWVALVVITVWWVNGGTMVIYQSALASIPGEHYEAASVDGASSWQKFLHITLPGIRYPLTFTLMSTLVAQFNIYGQPLMLTGFGNKEGNAVLLMYVIENAIKKQAAGISAAMAMVLGVCILAVSMIQLRVMRANSPD